MWAWLSTSFVLGTALPGLRLAVAQAPDCSGSASELCIDPAAAGEELFDFVPMFSSAKFIYAFQMGETSSGASAAKAGFWVDYREADLDASANQETFLAFLMVDGDGLDPDEPSWPCYRTIDDAVQGVDRCATQLKSHIVSSIAPDYDTEFGTLPDVLSRDNGTGADIGTCPPDILSRHTLVADNLDLGLEPGGTTENFPPPLCSAFYKSDGNAAHMDN